MNNIKYITYNYGVTSVNTVLHLIRLADGRGLLKTTDDMIALGLMRKAA